jgi:manganese transport protein
MGETTEQNRTAFGNLWTRLKQIGPAFVLAAVVVGPGSITLSTLAGSTYGYQLLWIPVIGSIFMMTYTWMAARVGLVTGDTLFQATREKYGSVIATIGGVFGFLSLLAFQAGNNAGVGFALNALVGGSVRIWAIVFTLLAIAFLFLPSLYGKLELLVKAIVAILIISFFGTLALVGVDVSAAAAGLVPSFPSQSSIFLAIGIIGTNFVIASAVYQTHLMKEKGWGAERLTEESFDTILGVGIIGLIVIAIMLTSAAVIYGQVDPVSSAQGMAQQLRPIAGEAAFYLFTIGFFFASLSSLVVNALIGATLLVDGYGGDPSMESRPVKMWAVVMMLIGLTVVLIFQGSPVELIRIAQALSIVALPLLGYLLMTISTDEELMGEYTNSTTINILGVLGYLVVIGIALNYLRTIIQSL